MPGKGCLERKAEKRKAERLEKLAEQGGPKRMVDDEDRIKPQGIDELSGDEREKHVYLCKCLAEAILEYDRGGSGVIVSNLGTHPKVQEAKKQDCFNKMRLSEIIDANSDLFDVDKADTAQGKWLIKLNEGAVEKVGAEAPDTSDLPEPIEESHDKAEALQAVRIEMIHALSKRGGSAQLNDIGQEPNLNGHRMKWFKKAKFVDIVHMFPTNFTATDQGHGNFMIELLSTDVSDDGEPTMKEKILASGGGKGKGKGKGGGFPWFGGGMDPMQMASMMGMMKGKGGGKGKFGKGGFGKKGGGRNQEQAASEENQSPYLS